MVGRILEWAFQFDAWLKQHIGRPYTIVLGISLGIGISANVRSLEQMIESPAPPSADRLVALVGTALVQMALLINQLAQLHEYRQYVRQRRAERKELKAARQAAKDQAKSGDAGPVT